MRNPRPGRRRPPGALVGLLAATVLAGCGGGPRGAPAPPSPGLHEATLRVDTRERSYTVYVPGSPHPAPGVVIVLHGGSGGSGARIRGFVGGELEALAEEEGFLVAYPDGLGGAWNDCRAGAAYGAKLQRVDDTAFIRRLIATLANRFGADRGRVFAMGYSNGGHLAYRLAVEMPDAVRGIAAFGANLPAPDAFDCREPTAPVAVMIVNGTADPINPFGDGDVLLPDGTQLGTVRSAEETLASFGRLAGHTGPPARSTVVGGSGSPGVESLAWSGPGRSGVVLYAVRGGGHTIPSPSARFPAFLGPVERRFPAVGEAVRFFGLSRDGLRIAPYGAGRRRDPEAGESCGPIRRTAPGGRHPGHPGPTG